jgi:hypothetical protein
MHDGRREVVEGRDPQLPEALIRVLVEGDSVGERSEPRDRASGPVDEGQRVQPAGGREAERPHEGVGETGREPASRSKRRDHGTLPVRPGEDLAARPHPRHQLTEAPLGLWKVVQHPDAVDDVEDRAERQREDVALHAVHPVLERREMFLALQDGLAEVERHDRPRPECRHEVGEPPLAAPRVEDGLPAKVLRPEHVPEVP